jgi:hypothetical protein
MPRNSISLIGRSVDQTSIGEPVAVVNWYSGSVRVDSVEPTIQVGTCANFSLELEAWRLVLVLTT